MKYPALSLIICFLAVTTFAGETQFFPEKRQELDQVIQQHIASNNIPGAVLWLERKGEVYAKAYGRRSIAPVAEAMTEDTIFDAASLTKVMATAPAVMLLVQRGKIDLKAPVSTYLPEFAKPECEKIQVVQLLTHYSGLRVGLGGYGDWSGYEVGIRHATSEKPITEPGTHFRYSDINYILLGEIVRRVSGEPLDEFARKAIYRPLKMNSTGFKPSKAAQSQIAPTEKTTNGFWRGVVHDPTARRMGGVAGHAGLFTTARDVALFSRMMLERGKLKGTRLFQPAVVEMMTGVHSPPGLPRRGLGWDIETSYSGPRGKHFPIGSYGHTGWTGTSLWIDPFSETFVILLSNRNHPTEAGSILSLRNVVGTLAAEATRDFNFAYVPGALTPLAKTTARPATRTVRNGIDVLRERKFSQLAGLKIGLITNHTGRDRQCNSTIDLLHTASNVTLKVLFSPEHGIRGMLDEKVSDSVDGKTGLPIFSLYGERRSPALEQLNGLDALVFDIQDIGTRFYTYISTMGNCMEMAAKANLAFYVLDRVNPITGAKVEGPLTTNFSFTAYHSIPVRHGMTVGELAGMINQERGFKAKLHIIKVEGWDRNSWLDETGLPWINPSPNMRSLTQATLYPGIGLLETTALSVGRGTDTPFEVIGAPYIDELQLAQELNAANLPGLRFVPIRFTPKSSKYQGKECGGVNIILLDRENCRIVEAGIVIAGILNRLYAKDFQFEKFNNLLASKEVHAQISAGASIAQIAESWRPGLGEFAARRARYLLY